MAPARIFSSPAVDICPLKAYKPRLTSGLLHNGPHFVVIQDRPGRLPDNRPAGSCRELFPFHCTIFGGIPLANHKSAIKRHKQSLQRAARNRSNRTRMKNAVKAVRAAVLEKDVEKAEAAFVSATSVLDKTATKGAIHWKTAARKISRLAKAVNGLKQA